MSDLDYTFGWSLHGHLAGRAAGRRHVGSQHGDLTAKRYVYFWVDGIYFGARMEEEA